MALRLEGNRLPSTEASCLQGCKPLPEHLDSLLERWLGVWVPRLLWSVWTWGHAQTQMDNTLQARASFEMQEARQRGSQLKGLKGLAAGKSQEKALPEAWKKIKVGQVTAAVR